MPDDLLSAIQVGASIGNMRVAQQERMMQLRSQAALNAIHERQLAAQADMLAQHAALYRQMADQKEQQQKDEDALSKSFGLQHTINTEIDGMSDDESMQQLIPVATAISPVYGEKMAKSYSEFKRGQAELVRANRPPPATKEIQVAEKVSQLRSQLRQSQGRVSDNWRAPMEITPQVKDEMENQQQIKDQLDVLQKDTLVEPQVKLIEGKKFLVNPKSGAVHEISKNITKREFIAQHVSNWVRDNPGITPDEAATSLSQFYDKYLGESTEQNSPAQPSQSPKATLRYDPNTKRFIKQ